MVKLTSITGDTIEILPHTVKILQPTTFRVKENAQSIEDIVDGPETLIVLHDGTRYKVQGRAKDILVALGLAPRMVS